MSATHSWFGAAAVKSRSTRSGAVAVETERRLIVHHHVKLAGQNQDQVARKALRAIEVHAEVVMHGRRHGGEHATEGRHGW